MRIREQRLANSEENVSLALKAPWLALASYKPSMLGFPTASLCRHRPPSQQLRLGAGVSGRPLKQPCSLLGRHWQTGCNLPAGLGLGCSRQVCGIGGHPGLPAVPGLHVLCYSFVLPPTSGSCVRWLSESSRSPVRRRRSRRVRGTGAPSRAFLHFLTRS